MTWINQNNTTFHIHNLYFMLDIIHLCVENNFRVNLFQSSLEIAIFCKPIVSVQRPWLLRYYTFIMQIIEMLRFSIGRSFYLTIIIGHSLQTLNNFNTCLPVPCSDNVFPRHSKAVNCCRCLCLIFVCTLHSNLHVWTDTGQDLAGIRSDPHQGSTILISHS